MSQEFEDRTLDEKEFDEYLRRDSAVSQRYQELGGRSVPSALDAKVLRQAQQQAAKKAGGRRPWLRWGGALAFAATALIAITVVLQPEVKAPGGSESATVAMAPAAPEPMADAAVVESQKRSDAETAALLRDASSLPVSPETGVAAKESVASDVASAPIVAESASRDTRQLITTTSQPSAGGASRALAGSSVARKPSGSNEKLAVTAERESNSRRLVGNSGSAAAVDRPDEELAAVAPSEDRRSKSRAPVSDQLVAASREESKREQDESRAKAEPPRTPAKSAPAVSPPPPAPQPVAATLELPPPPEQAAEGVATLETDRAIAPEQWVRWIRDFRTQGNQARADELLKRLRAAHPDFSVPAELTTPPQR